MDNFETGQTTEISHCGRNCGECSYLQENVEKSARELARAINDAMIAIAPIAGIAAGNRIEDAECRLRSASDVLSLHQCSCDVALGREHSRH